MDNMTTKQIAVAVGKDERTVQRWAKKTSAKMSSVADKMSSAGHGISAEYTLDEVIEIIEVGMGKNAAAIFRNNAESTNSVRLNNTYVTRVELMACIQSLDQRYLGVLQQKNLIIEHLEDTIKHQNLKINQLSYTQPKPTSSKYTNPNNPNIKKEIWRIIHSHASDVESSECTVWLELYYKYNLKYGIDLYGLAKIEQMSTIDYADKNGHSTNLYLLALELFPMKKKSNTVLKFPKSNGVSNA